MQIDRSVALIHVARIEMELFAQKIDQVRRAVVRHFKPHFVAESPFGKLTFERPPEVVHVFLVHEKIAVSCDTELVTTGDVHAGEELMDKGMDHRRQERKIVGPGGVAHRQVNHARERPRDLHDRGSVGAAEGIGPFERHQKVETLVEQFGKRMRGIQANRTQEREQFARKKPAHPPNVRRHPIGAFEKTDTLVGQLRDE